MLKSTSESASGETQQADTRARTLIKCPEKKDPIVSGWYAHSSSDIVGITLEGNAMARALEPVFEN